MIKQVSKNLLILFIFIFGGSPLIAQDSSTNVASTQTDWSVFTSDNPRSESASSIVEDMKKGVEPIDYKKVLSIIYNTNDIGLCRVFIRSKFFSLG